MMTDRELMQQALEALEQVAEYFNDDSCEAKTIIALRERLAQQTCLVANEPCKHGSWCSEVYCQEHCKFVGQPEQEPVAWANEIIDDLHALHDSEMIRELDSGDALIRLDAAIAAVEEAAQRHTAPQPAQQAQVAWHHPECKGECIACLIERVVQTSYGTQGLQYLRRHITAPQPAQQPLKWEDIRRIVREANHRAWGKYGRMATDEEIARAIERAHGIEMKP